MKEMDTAIPKITPDMHQRVAGDGDRTTSIYLLVEGWHGSPTLITPRQYTREGWKGVSNIVATVRVEHPVIMWGTSDEVLNSFRQAAIAEAVKLGLIAF